MKMFVDENIVMTLDGQDETLSPRTGEVTEIVTSDYTKLQNLPTLNGNPIIGDVYEEDPTVSAWAKENTKPNYTPEEVSSVPANNAITFAEIDEIFRQVFES